MFQPGKSAQYADHEIRQPLAAILTNAQAALRWLNRDHPDLDEARQAIERIVGNSLCARDIVNNASGMGSAMPPSCRPQRASDHTESVNRETVT